MGDLRELAVRVRWGNVARLVAVAAVAVLALRALASAGDAERLPPAGIHPVAPREPRVRLERPPKRSPERHARPRVQRSRAKRSRRRSEVRGGGREAPAAVGRGPMPAAPSSSPPPPAGGEFAP